MRLGPTPFVLLAVALVGCAGTRARPAALVPAPIAPAPIAPAHPIVPAGCHQPRGFSTALAREPGVYRAGPLLLETGQDLAQLSAGALAQGSGIDYAIAVLTGGRPAVLSVDQGSRARLSLQFASRPTAAQAANGESAVRFAACGGPVKRFVGGLNFNGSGCARLHVFEAGGPPIPMLIPIGNSLRGCPGAANPSPRPTLLRDTFLGVACSTPNSIVCDRLGASVSLRRPATLVTVTIAGRVVALDPPPDRGDDLWSGYLRDAGLGRPGPLDVHARRGRWYGEPQPNPNVIVTVFYADGSAASASGTGFMHPGFG